MSGSRARRKRQRFVLGQARRHQLRQTDRMQLAPGNARGHRLAAAGQHRNSHEQRIVRRRPRIVGKRVEEQIGMRVPRQMLGQARPAARRPAAADRRRAPAASRRGWRRRPDSRAKATARCPEPARSSRIQTSNTGGRILYGVLKQQKTKPLLRQPAVAARRNGCGDPCASGRWETGNAASRENARRKTPAGRPAWRSGR